MFLRYLVEFEGVKSDYSTIVPHYTKPYVIPSVYSVEEIRAIEETIDTGTVIGKRDYAMILLASRMGMRSGDIARLRIEDVQNRTDLDMVLCQEIDSELLQLAKGWDNFVSDRIKIWRLPSSALTSAILPDYIHSSKINAA